jgi:hypothetical protein
MTRICAASLSILAVLLFLSGPPAAHAAQSYDNCTGFITSVPATITTQGTWCLKQDLATAIASGNAITINTNNVTIDCNDFKLGGLGAGLATQTNGIYSINHVNATVRRCNIRGFYVGVNMDGSLGSGHLIEDNRFDGNTLVAIRVSGDGSTVRRNLVFDTGGSSAGSAAFGILALFAVDLLDNTISGVTATAGGNGDAVGIRTLLNSGSSIIGNRVRGLSPDGSGEAVGIRSESAGRIAMRDNELAGNAGTGSIAMDCFDANNSAKHNHIDAFASAFSVCSDDGGNIVRP